MLRRPATTLTVTSEDISAYEDRRVREMQNAAHQARQMHRQQLHAAMAARAEGAGSGRRRTQERVMGQQATSPVGPVRPPPNIFAGPGQAAQPIGGGGGGMQERLARARQQIQLTTPGAPDMDDSNVPDDMDIESDSGPEDSMLEARQQMQARRAAASTTRGERQGTPPVAASPQPPHRTREERIQGAAAQQPGGTRRR
ncbi:hypothetical protein MKZ38_002470 [Zalerion maritima]|uniref:Anaphase-promoting complex, subunit CDC26 n=1 Tax=Zalerion maritima TaxID=339359 RepID=A0AAD5WQT9_9PEZI|nr:hypothetical protein MKZ38_002470 [Zalerion maritima]